MFIYQRNMIGKFYDRKQRNKQLREDYFAGMEIPDLMIKYNLQKQQYIKS